MTSINTVGATRITLQFTLNRNIDAAALDVQSAMTTAGKDLPDDLPSPPSFRKVNPADSPILYLAISSAVMRLSDVNEYAENMMAQRISMVPGVAQVSVYGSKIRRAHPARSRSHGRQRDWRGRGGRGGQARQRQSACGHGIRPGPGIHRAFQRQALKRPNPIGRLSCTFQN